MITGKENSNSYARSYMNEIASNEGLSKPVWYPGGTIYYSFANVTYNEKNGFMKCIPGNDEAEAFEVSIVNIIYSSTYICIKVTYDSTGQAYGNQ
jgi:hypothetical protein